MGGALATSSSRGFTAQNSCQEMTHEPQRQQETSCSPAPLQAPPPHASQQEWQQQGQVQGPGGTEGPLKGGSGALSSSSSCMGPGARGRWFVSSRAEEGT